MWCVRACGGDVCVCVISSVPVCTFASVCVCTSILLCRVCVCVPYVLCINGRRGNSIDNALAIN